MATYTKLRDGSWGIKIQGAARVGEVFATTKKSGETGKETVTKIVWSGKDATTGRVVSICAIGAQARTGAPTVDLTRRRSGGRPLRRTGCSCGSVEGVESPSDCASCRHDA